MKWRSLDESTPGADTRSLREQLAERRNLIAQYVPADIQAVHTRVVADLKAAGIAERSLPVGAKAPAFELNHQRGNTISSISLLTKGKLVLFFLRGRWDPFCCGQAEAMNQALPGILAAGASLVAISPQTVQQSSFMTDQHQLRFPLLSDAGNQVARQFGLVYRVPDDQQAIYRRAFVNLPLANGDSSWELPIPATYILDREGRVVYASANPDYMERPEPEEILNHLL